MLPHAADKMATSLASDGSAIKAPACRTEILVRLWTSTDEGKKLLPDEATAKRHGAVAFIEDVIASKKGVLVSAEDGLFVSVLQNPADALVASRQILLGMRGFLDKSGDQPVSVSISMDASLQGTSPGELASETSPENPGANPAPVAQASADLKSLIRISRPAQVLLTHDLFQQVNGFTGLPLKPFQGRFGVFEYLWTSEDKLLQFQSAQSGFVDLIEVDTAAQQPEIPQMAPVASETYFEPRAKTPFGSAGEQTGSWKRIIRTPWGIAAVATILAAVVVTGGITLRGKKAAPVEKSVPDKQASAPVTPAPAPKPPETSHPRAGTDHQNSKQPPVVAANNPTSNVPVTTTKPPRKDPPRKNSEEGSDVERTVSNSSPPPTSECNLTGNMQVFVRIAEDNRSHGEYENAKRLFGRILACEPNNQDAKRGLERTKAAEAASAQ